MKRVLSTLMVLIVLLTLCAGCAGGEDTGPLRICIDIPVPEEFFAAESYVENFLSNAKDYGAIKSVEDIEIEIVPNGEEAEEERKGVLTRLRTEIASGEGPDIFLIGSTIGAFEENPLFRYPERAIAQKRFLKLDGYIDNAQFMEWDKLFPPIMDAGKTEDGQFLLPMAYTFHVTIYNTPDTPMGLTPETTWKDMLESPDLLVQYGGDLREPGFTNRLTSLLGRVTDKQGDALTLSKEQLEDVYKTGLNQFNSPMPEALPEYCQADLTVAFDNGFAGYPEGLRQWNMKMVPMCSLNGGVTATVTSFCGINANTKRPEEAFALLDLLLSREFQQHSGLYGGFLQSGLPVYDGLMQEEAPVQDWYFSSENYQAFLDAKALITSAKFRMPSDFKLTLGHNQSQVQEDVNTIIDEVYRDMEMGLAES